MNQQEFFTKILKILEKLQIPYMISGSVGSMIYGEPRMTNDMDIIVELETGKVRDLLANLSKDHYYYPSIEFIQEAIRKKKQFNIIHEEIGSKVDFIIRKDTEFAKKEFSRKNRVPFTENFSAFTASPEDIIISKMLYFRMNPSERHITDIVSILIISGDKMDFDYLNQWIEKSNIQDIWEQIEKKRKEMKQDK